MSTSGSDGVDIEKISPYYGYIPSLPVTIIFTALFTISTVIHIGQFIRYRLRYLLYTAIAAGLFEITGWSARLYSHFHPDELGPYLVQTITTINGPTPLVAAYFVILAEIIRRLGPCYSRLKPNHYAIVFVTADLVALSVQGVGGALASIAAGNHKSPDKGGRIMLGGIVFQMLAITIYMGLAIEFIYRFLNDRPFRERSYALPLNRNALGRNMKYMLVGSALSSLMIYVRSIYRTIELTDGWNGRIIRNEVYFNVMDGAMIVASMYCLNVFHPGALLGSPIVPAEGEPMLHSSIDLVEKGSSSVTLNGYR